MDFQKFYDAQPDYELFRSDSQSREEYSIIADWKIRKMIECLPQDFEVNNIFEVGCAFGYILNNISDRLNISDRTGIDISGKNIEAARSYYNDCTFFRGTLDEFVSAGNQSLKLPFELTILSDIVEHIPDDKGFLNSVRSISRYVLLNVPLEKSFSTRNRNYGEQDRSGHLRSYDEADAVKLIEASGFEIINSFTSVAFFDKQYREVYKKRRSSRIMKKSLLKMIFWALFYFVEDRLKLISSELTRKFIGTNYFALLRNPDF